MSNEIPEMVIRTKLSQVTASGRPISFSVKEGPMMIFIDRSVVGGDGFAGIRLTGGTVYWEHLNPIEYRREPQKMEEGV